MYNRTFIPLRRNHPSPKGLKRATLGTSGYINGLLGSWPSAGAKQGVAQEEVVSGRVNGCPKLAVGCAVVQPQPGGTRVMGGAEL